MTLLWAVLALQLGSSIGCFITNCPQGGKRSSPALVPENLQLPTGTAPFLPLDTQPQLPAELPRQPSQQAHKRFLLTLQPRYQHMVGAQPKPQGTCNIEGVCSYPDCCSFDACVDATECRVLRKGYRILVEYIFSKMEGVGSAAMAEGAAA